ncbi:uncharacterized protein MYCFIDRAFT_82303 [Pseudocercospora fijiensis CIRAD86]|uniref:Uncharacterized protein n=1 Tax=Pseudocercospora fijiensis (strain CIRAD86) TaxID=383855 RepID=M3AYY3_PSEFD|nr:uncharacterized protein MYCFIDRAFT_82303 [Pseudocercospora fijiensis CIRAD86]EME82383.1 hypothetical protein MYCFIDRAFT_82303 [Pseudocercospora fijiensis CIRAD86]
MNNTILEALPYTPSTMTLQNTTISDNNMGSETFPSYSTSQTSTPTTKQSDSPTNTPYNSISSTNASTQQVAHAESTTNDESNGVSDHTERRRGSRANGLSAGSSAARSRSRGAWGEHRMAKDEKVWAQDKERKHGKLFERIFDHKLAPEFLK